MKRKIAVFIFALIVWHLSASTAPAEDWFRVKWVNDGDTILLMNGKSVRYIGINATEIDHKNKTAEPFGYAARRMNLDLVRSKRIRLEFDVEHHDRYGRMLAYVFLKDGTFVNARLLEEGLAYFYFKKPNIRYERQLLKSQRRGMKSGKGIWQKWSETKDRYIGNKKSKRFHLSTCNSAKKIHRKNKVYFSKRWDAFWAGYAPAGRCQPVFTIPSE